jgi:predicted lipoprotein with Yx(FWY)xxD motif
MKKSLVTLSLALAAVLTAHAAPAVERGGMLADGKGMTLYVFKKDAANQSTCYDGCAKAWPPFFVGDPAKADAEFTVVQRKDGTKQWAFKGQPLYYYAGDAAPGEATGEGSGGVWYVVKTGHAPSAKGPAPNSGY